MKPDLKSSRNDGPKGAGENVAAPFRSIELRNLFQVADWQDEIPWKPFLEGAEIHRLYGNGVEGPTAVLIRFRQEAQVPVHLHAGYEHVFVLAGEQRDQNATRGPGAFTINPPGTTHGVFSEAGTIVLVIYEKPVVFL